MYGVFHWSDAIAFFGPEIDAHRSSLSTAQQTTYALLACRSTPGERVLLTSRDGEHAERRLMLSALWTKQIEAALAGWVPGDAPMVILLALNRSPCADCAQVLAGALHALERRYALRCEQQSFVLASLGYYEGRRFMVGESAPHHQATLSRSVTTSHGLQALREAGWKPCVLDFGHGMTRRGQELHDYLRHLR